MWKPFWHLYIPKEVGMFGIYSLVPHSMLRFCSPPSVCQATASPLEVPSSNSNPPKVTPSLGLLKSMPIGYLRPDSRICDMTPFLSSWGSPRNCFALFMKPGFTNSVWLADYIISDGFPRVRDSKLISIGTNALTLPAKGILGSKYLSSFLQSLQKEAWTKGIESE